MPPAFTTMHPKAAVPPYKTGGWQTVVNRANLSAKASHVAKE